MAGCSVNPRLGLAMLVGWFGPSQDKGRKESPIPAVVVVITTIVVLAKCLVG